MDAAQVQNIVQAAIAAALAAFQQQQPLPVPPVAPAFAETPAGVGVVAWDFTSATGIKLYTSATAPFTTPFDGKQNGLSDFLRKIASRAETYGFTDILMVPDDNGVDRDLTREYGCLTIDNIRAVAIPHFQGQGRPRQASSMLRKLIQESITASLADRLTHRKDNYTVNAAAAVAAGQPVPVPIPREAGPAMLYELISMVSIETRATVAGLTKKLTNLTPIMQSVKQDIAAFNAQVDLLMDALRARNAHVPDVLPHLFEAYNSCDDALFTKYISDREDSYEDRTIDLTHVALMQLALEKYKILLNKGKWMKPSESELEFIAMKAELYEIKQNAKAITKSKTPAKKADSKKDKDKNDVKFAWKLVPPKPGEATTKTFNGKKYIYCPHHQRTCWVLEINNEGIEHRTGCKKMAEAAAITNVGEIDTDEADLEENL
jgi:hypothetical protein